MFFSKYHGAGNDFILIDDRALFFPCDDSHLIQQLCDRQRGIGADGLILVQPSRLADHRMRIFNADGKEAAMCGNGLRCLIRFLCEIEGKEEGWKIETAAGVLSGAVNREDHLVTLNLGAYRLLENGLIDTGVPHLVVFVSDLSKVDVKQEGREIRYASLYEPHGTNVTFAQVHNQLHNQVHNKRVRIRTYERGIEGETLACGTGAAAAAVAAMLAYEMPSELLVEVASGEQLKVGLNASKEIHLTGSAQFVFRGEYPR